MSSRRRRCHDGGGYDDDDGRIWNIDVIVAVTKTDRSYYLLVVVKLV